MRQTTGLIIALLLTGCATGEPAASILPPAAGADVIANLDITVTPPSRDPITYTIACLGDTFTITPQVEGLDAVTACIRLSETEVIDRLVSGAPQDQICTEIYGGEDVATITGTIDDLTVDTAVDRTNGCGINDWDMLLAGILPRAVGVTG